MNRKLGATLGISTAGLAAILAFEGFSPTAYVPIKGDVPTVGHGVTQYADGTKVKTGDKMTVEQSRQEVKQILKNRYETGLHACIGDVPLYQYEWDAYVSLAYNVGYGAVCKSSINRKLHAGDYEAACATLLQFNGVVRKRPDGTKYKIVIKGLDNRRKKEYKTCMNQ